MGDTVTPSHDPGPLTLERRASTATWWSLLGTLLVAAGVFFVIDTDGHVLAWVALALFAVVDGWFLTQLLTPNAVCLHLDREAVRARNLFREVEVPWERIHVARVRRVAGDPVLSLEVREPSPTGDAWRYRVVTVALPVGADLDALHDHLARRLGRGPIRPPREVRPLDI